MDSYGIKSNLFSIDEPMDVGGRKGVVACAGECHPVANWSGRFA